MAENISKPLQPNEESLGEERYVVFNWFPYMMQSNIVAVQLMLGRSALSFLSWLSF